MPKIDIDRALVLSAKRYNETSFIVNLFSREDGRYAGLFKGKTPPQPGTFVQGRWQARLSEQLGNLYIETLDAFSIRFLDDKRRLAAISSVCFWIEKTLPERQAHQNLFDQTDLFLTHLDNDDFLKNYAHWEMDLLELLGFGLDLGSCAGCGKTSDLTFISPNTGRAVCTICAEPYREKLLTLPSFMCYDAPATAGDIRSGINLTGFFLHRHFGTLPPARSQLI